jgi:hypothetical protein
MAESLFVKRLKTNLSEEITNLLHNRWGLTTFEVCCESAHHFDGRLNGRGDITIFDLDDLTKTIGIEIEHKSSYEQSVRNIKKFRDWSHNSQYRSCGLLHIFNKECNLTENPLCSIAEYGKTNERKQSGFFYDTFFYRIDDSRETRQMAIQIAEDIEFRMRLWILLRCVGLVRN